jgi:hypothetical protein
MNKTVYFGKVKKSDAEDSGISFFQHKGKLYDFSLSLELEGTEVVLRDAINRYVPITKKDSKLLIKALKKLNK